MSNLIVKEVLDFTGLRCPMPLLKTKQAIKYSQSGDVIRVLASDRGALRDIPAYLKQAQHRLVSKSETDTIIEFIIEVS